MEQQDRFILNASFNFQEGLEPTTTIGLHFFLEAAHIILPGKKELFLENVKGTKTDLEKEEETNTFAAILLLKEKEWQQILDDDPLNEKMIYDFAYQFRTPVGVIISRLEHLKRIPFQIKNGVREKSICLNWYYI